MRAAPPSPIDGMLHDPFLLIMCGLFVAVAISWAITSWLKRKR